MAMEPPGTLKQQVYRSDLAHHEIEVKVKALLDNLRGNEYGAVRAGGAVFAEAGENGLLPATAFGSRIAGVVEPDGNVVLS